MKIRKKHKKITFRKKLHCKSRGAEACIAGLHSWRDALHLATRAIAFSGAPLSAVNAAAAVCGGLRSSSGVFKSSTEWSWTFHLLRSAVKVKVQLDIVAFNAMLGAAAGAFAWPSALSHFSALQEHGLSPDRITYSAFAFLPWQSALRLAFDMMRQSLRSDACSLLKSAASAATSGSKWQLGLGFLSEDQAQDSAATNLNSKHI